MRFALSVAALAGAAMAAPAANVVLEVYTVVETVYVTAPAATSTPVYHAPEVKTTVQYEAAKPSPTYHASPKPDYDAKPQPSYEPQPQPEPTPAAPAPANPESGYMKIVNTWRSNMGMSKLECTDLLESNAMKTVMKSNGQMVHDLNPGTYAQVLAPGGEDDFEHVFVGGWLCEIPTLPGLNGVCDKQSQGWTYAGQTGHAEILTNKAYTKIGCALYAGIWSCDLAGNN